MNHPSHYTNHPSGIECLQITRLLTPSLSNSVKYVFRREDKENQLQDLDKALFYINDAIEYDRNGEVPIRIPETAKELLLTVAEHDPDPTAAEFYRAVALGRVQSARAHLTFLRGSAATAA